MLQLWIIYRPKVENIWKWSITVWYCSVVLQCGLIEHGMHQYHAGYIFVTRGVCITHSYPPLWICEFVNLWICDKRQTKASDNLRPWDPETKGTKGRRDQRDQREKRPEGPKRGLGQLLIASSLRSLRSLRSLNLCITLFHTIHTIHTPPTPCECVNLWICEFCDRQLSVDTPHLSKKCRKNNC